MKSKLLKAHIPPKEVEKFLEALVPPEGGVITQPLKSEGKHFHFDADLTVDFRDATAWYKLGALTYGPVDIALKVRKMSFIIDWHRDLNIPHEICIDIKDPCGHQLIKECIHFDLGVTELVFIQNHTERWREKMSLLDVSFRDKDHGGDYYALTGDIPFVEDFARLLLGLVRGKIKQLGEDLVTKLLEHVLGTGDLAKLFIEAIKLVFRIVDILVGFLIDLIALMLRPIDELLHKIFGDLLEITLNPKGFPKKLPVIAEDKARSRPPVTVDITTPPFITLAQSGVELEVYK